MIQEDYVSFKTAKLLKEKGFKCNTVHYYYNEDGNLLFSSWTVDVGRNEFVAPTLQMVTKWLQEAFNVVIIPNYEYECDDTPWCYKIFKLGENGKPERVAIKGVSYDKNNNPTEHIVGYRDYERSYKDYFTKEEAVEEGIKYCLKFDLNMNKNLALETLRSFVDNTDNKIAKDAILTLVPELCESKDERIRKKCIELIKRVIPSGDSHSQESEEILDCIAYLERQKEDYSDFLEEDKKYMEKYIPLDKTTLVKLLAERDRNIDGSLESFEKQNEQKPILEVFGFKVGDAVRLKDGDGRKHIIKSFEEVEGVYGPNFYHVEFEDDSARDGIYPGEEYPNGYYTQMEKIEEEQKPAENNVTIPQFNVGDYIKSKTYNEEHLIKDINKNGYVLDIDMVIPFKDEDMWEVVEQKPTKWSKEEKDKLNSIERLIVNANAQYLIGDKKATELQHFIRSIVKPTTNIAEWSEEDEEMLDLVIGDVTDAKENLVSKDAKDFCDREIAWLKSLPERFNLQPKQEWGEKDNIMLENTILCLKEYCLTDEITWLKSLRPQPKQDVLPSLSEKEIIFLKRALDYLRKEHNRYGGEDFTNEIAVLEWLITHPILVSDTHCEPSKQNYDGNMDKECIKLCDILNSIPSIDTFESCCGHLKDRYSIWFFCNEIITISRLGRCVERNYSDGKWELLVDSTDTHPTGVFWLRSKEPFQSYDEMEKSVNGLCNCIQYWFNTKFDSYFNGNTGK